MSAPSPAPDGPTLTLPQPADWYAGDLLQRASEYLRACRRLDAGGDHRELVYPAYFLVAHATELALKAYLAAQGVPKSELRKRWGHRLAALYGEARRLGLPEIEKLDLVVAQLADLNEEQSLRYPAYFVRAAPRPEDYAEVVEKMLSNVGPEISLNAWLAAARLRAAHPGVGFIWEDDA